MNIEFMVILQISKICDCHSRKYYSTMIDITTFALQSSNCLLNNMCQATPEVEKKPVEVKTSKINLGADFKPVSVVLT